MAFLSSLGGTISITIVTANYVKTGQTVTCYFDFTKAQRKTLTIKEK